MPDTLALLRLPVSPASLLLSVTLHCLERGTARSSWRQGRNRQQAPQLLPHDAVEHTEKMWLFSWNHPAPRASSSQPPRAPESQDSSDRLRSFTCAQLWLPRNAVKISSRRETQVWFSHGSGKSGPFFPQSIMEDQART